MAKEKRQKDNKYYTEKKCLSKTNSNKQGMNSSTPEASVRESSNLYMLIDMH